MKRGPDPHNMSLTSLSTFNRCEHDRSPTEDRRTSEIVSLASAAVQIALIHRHDRTRLLGTAACEVTLRAMIVEHMPVQTTWRILHAEPQAKRTWDVLANVAANFARAQFHQKQRHFLVENAFQSPSTMKLIKGVLSATVSFFACPRSDLGAKNMSRVLFLEILVLKVGLAESDPCTGRIGAGVDEEVLPFRAWTSRFTVLRGLCQMFSTGSVPWVAHRTSRPCWSGPLRQPSHKPHL